MWRVLGSSTRARTRASTVILPLAGVCTCIVARDIQGIKGDRHVGLPLSHSVRLNLPSEIADDILLDLFSRSSW